MAKIAPYFNIQLFDNNGDPLSGGKVYAYEAGTSTPKDTFTDSEGGTANTNPVILDSAGRASIWLDSGAYNLVTRDLNDVFVDEADNITGDATNAFASSVVNLSSNTNITTVYLNNFISCTSTFTLSLLSSAVAEEGFLFVVKNDGTGLITIDPDGSETIDNQSTLVLNPQAFSIVVSDGVNWKTLTNNDAKNNLIATTAPTINDDSDGGYGVGSRWLDTTADEAYVCLDATVGAAVWLNSTLTVDDLGTASLLNSVDEDDMASDSNILLPTQQSVKAYVDSKQLVEGTSQSGTGSETQFDFTSIPSTVKKITIMFYDLTPDTSDDYLVQIGDDGGVETSSYESTSALIRNATTPVVGSSTSGFIIEGDGFQSGGCSGHMVLTRVDTSGTIWVSSHAAKSLTNKSTTGAGSKTLSNTLDRVRITSTTGTLQFQSGSVNIQYEV